MTDIQWVGSVSGDLGVAGNYSPAQVPINGDTLYVDTGSVQPTAGLDQSAVSPAAIIMTDGYSGDWGSSSGFVQYGTITLFLFSSGGPSAYVQAATITTAEVSGGQSGDDMLHLKATTAMPLLTCGGGSGTLTVEDGSDLVKLRVDSGASGLTVAVGTSVTNASEYIMQAGRTTLETVAPTIRVEYEADCTIAQSAGAISTLLKVSGNAVCRYNSDGTITLLEVWGPRGLYDATENEVPTTVTITDSTVYSGGTMDLRNGAQNFTRTNGTTIRGGIIRHDYGEVVA